MAPTETTGSQSSPNQSSEHITDAKPKQPESSKVNNKPETAQNQSTDLSTTGHLQRTVNKPSELTDPATVEILGGATKSSSMKKSSATGSR
jgi:hypothetical protein